MSINLRIQRELDNHNRGVELHNLKLKHSRLEQAFRRYASHDDDCAANSWGDAQCNCGYREVLGTLNPE